MRLRGLFFRLGILTLLQFTILTKTSCRAYNEHPHGQCSKIDAPSTNTIASGHRTGIGLEGELQELNKKSPAFLQGFLLLI